jgi:tellurite resistance protein
MAGPATQQQKKPVSDSMFNMWRCIIMVAHADGVIHEKESEFFEKVFVSMAKVYALTEAHHQTWQEDLATVQSIEALLARVTDPECKSMLLYFSQVVAWIDGNLSPDEAALLKKLHNSIMPNEPTEKIMADIRADIAARVVARKDTEKSLQRNPLFFALDALLARLGVELIE